MAINNITNGEAGNSVRSKLNQAILWVNKLINGEYALVTQLGRQTVSFNAAVKLDKNYRAVHIIAGPLAYTLDETVATDLGSRVDHITSDGINEPTFDPAKFTMAWYNYKNEANVKHRIFFEPSDGTIDVYVTYK
jgi:hypothetical protein